MPHRSNILQFRRFKNSLAVLPLSMLLLFATAFEAQSSARVVSQSLFGRASLPVYNYPNGDPKIWVQRNSVHFLNRAADFSVINRRINSQLSTACILGRFNQRKNNAYFVIAQYKKKNVVVLGYAHGRGINLHDPTGIADTQSGYLFRYDKSGKCQVFSDN